MQDQDLSIPLQAQVANAIASQTALRIIGGNSKSFYAATSTASTPLELKGHRGVIAYEPSELVITARAGTPLTAIAETLATEGQMLGFEPPYFSPHATIGGTIACGFSGPRRPFAGSARDFILGCRILNGHAETLKFGGQVIKNVAGFDISRLMVGALGQLGVLLELSLRVLPTPEAEITLCHVQPSAQSALADMQHWQRQALPLSALCHAEGITYLRLSGAAKAIHLAAQKIGGDIHPTSEQFWIALREQQLPFFQQQGDLWRLSLPPATPPLDLPGAWLLDWGGAQRWLMTSTSAAQIHSITQAKGGHASCFRGQVKADWISLAPELLVLHQNIKRAFDPHGLFNPSSFNPAL